MVTNLYIRNQLALRDNNASAFVAADEWQLDWQRPVAVQSVQVGVAYAREFDVDQDLVRAGLLHGDLLVLDRAARLLDDLRPLHLGDFWGHCCELFVGLTE